MKYPYEWRLQTANFPKNKGKVFSCFACGGGSTMGYKLAGFDVIGFNEIDPRMAKLYEANHSPKLSYCEPIQTFKLRKDLPKELYELDILDGSPPCSSFSMSGKREKHWGNEKHFREGQAKQMLDTLFFDFIDLAAELQPKIVIAENVKGLLIGNAKDHVRRIYAEFDSAGYIVQHFLLDAAKMGVPQRRERVFFIALRKDLATPYMIPKDLFTAVPSLRLSFRGKQILFGSIKDAAASRKPMMGMVLEIWTHRQEQDNDFADTLIRWKGRDAFFGYRYLHDSKVCPTIVSSSGSSLCLYEKPFFISDTELIRASSFPSDYNFRGQSVRYVVGMSVPPLMIANIADAIYEQWRGVFDNFAL